MLNFANSEIGSPVLWPALVKANFEPKLIFLNQL